VLISWGHSSVIGLLVVMSVVVVLVLLLFSFLVDGVGAGCLSTCSLQSVTAFCFGSVASCLISFFVRRLPALRAVVGRLPSLCVD